MKRISNSNSGRMPITRIAACLLVVFLLTSGVPLVASGQEVVVVKTADALKQVLSGDANVHVRLGANITSSGKSAGEDFITTKAGVHHILDLNGYTLTHTYVNSSRENDGTTIRVNGSLTVNGPGAITGGHDALMAAPASRPSQSMAAPCRTTWKPIRAWAA
jgi:hypothetical protein